MPRTYNEPSILCPFYLSNGKRSISCEGITDECKITLLFKSQEERDKHRSIFCDAKYQNCEICAMLEKKYEE